MAGDTTGGITDSRDSSTALGLDLYRVMTLIRQFEETAQALYLRGEVHGSIHLCIGQEAVSAGVCGVLGDSDLVAATYRGHGHALALGVDPSGFLAELPGSGGWDLWRPGRFDECGRPRAPAHRMLWNCRREHGGGHRSLFEAPQSRRSGGGILWRRHGQPGIFSRSLNFAKVF